MKKLLILLLFFNFSFAQIDTGNYTFNNFSTYTKCNPATILTQGLNIQTFGNETINTNISIDSSIYSIELFGTLLNNSASHLGFGLKNGSQFRSIIYRGSTGSVDGINFCNITMQTPQWRVNGSTYSVGDRVSVKVYFDGLNVLFQTSKNGVYSQLLSSTFPNLGELCIVIRQASTWSNLSVNIQTKSNYSDAYIDDFGNDTTGDGSFYNPYKSVGKALDKTKGIGMIYALEGDYYNDITFLLNRNIKLTGVGQVRFVYGEVISTATSLNNDVYEITHAPIFGNSQFATLWHHDIIDTNSFIDFSHDLITQNYGLTSLKTIYKSSLSALQTADINRSYWYYGNGKLYFKLKQGTNLSDNPIVIPSKGGNTLYNHVINGGRDGINVELNNIEIMYAPIDLAKTKFTLYGVKCGYTNTNYAFHYGYCKDSQFTHCKAQGVNSPVSLLGDGFNAHSDIWNEDGYGTNVYFYGCTAMFNADEGFSGHSNTYSDLYYCLANNNGSGGFSFGAGGDALLTDCFAVNNGVTGFGVFLASQDGTTSNLQTFSCTAKNNITNYYSDGLSDMKFEAYDCISSQGSGYHFSSGVELSNCTIQQN